MVSKFRGTLFACALIVSPAAVTAAADTSKSAELIFDPPHLELVQKGSEVTYKFERKVSDEKLAGPAYTDEIRVGVFKVMADGKRDVSLQVFTGDRARVPWSETGMTGNPLLLWYLDNCINQFRAVAGGDRDFLKNTFKVALRDKSTYEEVKAEFGGKQVDAVRVSVVPFADSKDAKKMRGFEKSKFTILLSPAVPGYFLEMASEYQSSERGTPMVNEKINLVGMGAAK
ncbi:MAG: hypothetical protein ABL894_09395 [Hyphomicrobium sp.]